MKMFRVQDLKDHKEGHILQDFLPGDFIHHGGLSFSKPGDRSHTKQVPEGQKEHTHEDIELFLIVQGKGQIEINKDPLRPVTTGDIVVVEPGEDHHLISSVEDPLVVLWSHAGSVRHKDQL